MDSLRLHFVSAPRYYTYFRPSPPPKKTKFMFILCKIIRSWRHIKSLCHSTRHKASFDRRERRKGIGITYHRNKHIKFVHSPSPSPLFYEQAISDDVWISTTALLPLPTRCIIDYSSIKIFERVGYGHFSKVNRGQYNGIDVAVKKLRTKVFRRERDKLLR